MNVNFKESKKHYKSKSSWNFTKEFKQKEDKSKEWTTCKALMFLKKLGPRQRGQEH